jgi:hypothetical protein
MEISLTSNNFEGFLFYYIILVAFSGLISPMIRPPLVKVAQYRLFKAVR